MGNKQGEFYDCFNILLDRVSTVQGEETQAEPREIPQLRRWSWKSKGVKATRVAKKSTKKKDSIIQRELCRSEEGPIKY